MIPLQATPAGNAPEISVPSVDWLAISPLIALMAGALLIILLRSVVRRSPHVYFASVVLAKLALVAAAVLLVIQWHVVSDDGPSSTARRHVPPRPVRRVPERRDRDRRAPRAARLVQLPAAGEARGAGVLRPDPAVGDGHGRDDERERPHRRVPRARDPLDPALRARRLRPPPARVAGGRHQVLRARRILLGRVPLRHRDGLRRHRHDVDHRHRATSSPRTRCSSRVRSSWASRCCSWASASRSRRSRSTCGRPTCTRVRPRR